MFRKPYQSGTGAIYFLMFLLLAGILGAGFFVYSQNSSDEYTDQPLTAQKSYRVLAVGDIACDPNDPNFNRGNGQNGTCRHKAVAELMNGENPDSIILLGDIQYNDGRLEAFEKSFVPVYKNINAPMIVAAGNHDWQTGNLDGYLKAFEKYLPEAKVSQDQKTYFTSSVGDWKVYVLDSDCNFVGGCSKDSPQYKWLKSQFEQSTPKCTIAAWHHPVFTSGLHRRENDKEILADLYNLLSANKVDVLLTGHDHNYERFKKQSIDEVADDLAPRSFVVGTGGAKLRELTQPYAKGHEFGASEHGYLRLILNQQSYSWQFINTDDKTLDSGSDSCSG